MTDQPTENRNRTFVLLLLGVLLLLTVALGVSAPSVYPESDTATIRTALAVVGTFWLFAIGLLLWTRYRALALGVVFTAAGMVLIAGVLLTLVEVATGRWTTAFRGLAILYGFLTVVVAGAASLRARNEGRSFVAGIVTAMLLLVVLVPAASSIFQGRLESLQQDRNTRRVDEARATSRVFALTSCVLGHHAETGARTFPRALTDLAGSAICPSETIQGELPGYRLTYTPGADVAAGFQLVARPSDSIGDDGVVVADARGLVFVVRPRPGAGNDERLGVYLFWKERGLGPVFGMQRIIGQIIEDARLTAPPESLAPFMADTSTSISQFLGATLADDRPYKVEYVHAPDGDPGTFGVRATCQRYGDACIRSYYRGPDGRIHGTGLPRAATAGDPGIDRLEDSNGDVTGIVGWGGR